jgi:phytoene dehydrogenase-like protein
MSDKYDAVVIGSGPNGLSAAITLAQKGKSVALYEAKETIGGGMRSAELTLPGFIHDICSAIHPMAVGSPFFNTLSLESHGLKWIHPEASLAHPFDDGSTAMLERSIDSTSATLKLDAEAYKNLMKPLVFKWDKVVNNLLGPLSFPEHPLAMLNFGLFGIQSASRLARSHFKGKLARGFFAGMAAHSIMPLDKSLTAAFGLVLGIVGHVHGWPMASGGSQNIANALTSVFTSLGGKIFTGVQISKLDELDAPILLFDVGPKQLLNIAGKRFSNSYKRKLESYRYGPGVFKMDWALHHPIPWKNKECLRAGTVHLGGSLEEIEQSEREVWENRHPEKPFIIMAQQSLLDERRAPSGKHTAWGYCHVPNGSTFDMSERIEKQIERFAPGFRDCIFARSSRTTADLEKYNPNNIGGDITGGVQDVFQLFSRPVSFLRPYSTPKQGIYICSSSTPPGGGVHGMCGYHAALEALKRN